MYIYIINEEIPTLLKGHDALPHLQIKALHIEDESMVRELYSIICARAIENWISCVRLN